jgi:hypothetical protein
VSVMLCSVLAIHGDRRERAYPASSHEVLGSGLIRLKKPEGAT